MALLELSVEVEHEIDVFEEGVRGRVVAHEHKRKLQELRVAVKSALPFTGGHHGGMLGQAAQTLVEEDQAEDVIAKGALLQHLTVPQQVENLVEMVMRLNLCAEGFSGLEFASIVGVYALI